MNPKTYVNTSKHIADTLTKDSFTRERWTQLTNLLNFTTPHVRSCSHFSVLFLSVQNDDRTSKYQAETITESAAANQRPVHNLCAYAPHAASSSSSSKCEFLVEIEAGEILGQRRTDWTRMCNNHTRRMLTKLVCRAPRHRLR